MPIEDERMREIIADPVRASPVATIRQIGDYLWAQNPNKETLARLLIEACGRKEPEFSQRLKIGKQAWACITGERAPRPSDDLDLRKMIADCDLSINPEL